jgi:hypothetical protein
MLMAQSTRADVISRTSICTQPPIPVVTKESHIIIIIMAIMFMVPITRSSTVVRIPMRKIIPINSKLAI